jgi:hypothetical protein
MSQHTIKAIWELDRDSGEELEVEITFKFVPLQPAIKYGLRAEPYRPASVEFISAKADALDAGAFNDLRDARIAEWAEEWLAENEADAIDRAYGDIFADEDARDEARANGQFGMGA